MLLPGLGGPNKSRCLIRWGGNGHGAGAKDNPTLRRSTHKSQFRINKHERLDRPRNLAMFELLGGDGLGASETDTPLLPCSTQEPIPD